MDKKDIYFIYSVIILIILIFFYIIVPYFYTQPTVHVLFTRYKEPDMSLILEPFINRRNIHVYIYNKGSDVPTGIPEDANNITIINIPNLGWDSYGYVYHVIKNYNKLPHYITNLHASAQYLPGKKNIYLEIVDHINDIVDPKNENKKPIYYGGVVLDESLDFRLEDWSATLDVNKQTDSKYTKSSIYPLKNWLESKLIKIPNNVMFNENKIKTNYLGQFLVHKSKILRYKKSFYKNILNEISVWQSEVNHYLERSWYVFYGED